jgi:hypothetical protein
MAVQQQAAAASGPAVPSESDMSAQPFVYSPWRFFRVMLAVAWSTFAHPFSSTVIDVETGRVCNADGEEGE